MPYRRSPKPGEPDYRHIPKAVTVTINVIGALAAVWIIWMLIAEFA